MIESINSQIDSLEEPKQNQRSILNIGRRGGDACIKDIEKMRAKLTRRLEEVKVENFDSDLYPYTYASAI